MDLPWEDASPSCEFRSRQRELESHFIKSKRSVARVLASYGFVVCIAFSIFIVPVTDQFARFGAMLILFPTIVTGIHVFLLSRLSGDLGEILSESGRGMACRLCESVYKTTRDAITENNKKLHLVIICETVLASIGTCIWAFGDCFSPHCCLV